LKEALEGISPAWVAGLPRLQRAQCFFAYTGAQIEWLPDWPNELEMPDAA